MEHMTKNNTNKQTHSHTFTHLHNTHDNKSN